MNTEDKRFLFRGQEVAEKHITLWVSYSNTEFYFKQMKAVLSLRQEGYRVHLRDIKEFGEK